MITLARLAFRQTTVAASLTAALALFTTASAQQLSLPSDPLGAGDTPLLSQGSSDSIGSALATDAPTIVGASSVVSSGTLYNPATGSHLRLQYNTESYGQAEGNLDIGTMILRDLNGGVSFFDGQVTLNDESNVGYNLGWGYRWMTLPLLPYSPDDAKIMGVSVWADGQGAGGENFFPQIGTSLEFLGDRFDFRANGYAPLGDRTQTRDFVGTGDLAFSGNNLGERTRGVLDTALTVAEAELAARIADLEAWAFGGVYGFSGGGFEEVGGKLGLRGYLTPDLSLSVAVTHDDLFETNGVMRLTWFIGRTRRENCPTGTLHDRLREPVIRNDYVALAESTVFGIQNVEVDANGDAVRIVHVDSTAAPGGDGSFENPLDMLSDIQANSMEGDTILVHGGSSFTGDGAVLQDDQRLLGEGGGIDNTIVSTNGTITLPETATGALTGAIPTINDSPVAGVTLADDNTVNNLAFDGGMAGITSDNLTPDSSASPTLTNLAFTDTMGNAINLLNEAVADTEDFDNDNNTTETIAQLGNVTIDNVTFDNVSGVDISIDAMAVADNVLADVIAISNVTSTNNAGATNSLEVSNTNGVAGGSISITDYDVTNSPGGLLFSNNDDTLTVDGATVTGSTGGNAIEVNGASAIVNIQDTDVSNAAGNGILVNGNTAVVNIGAAGTGNEVNIDGVTGTALVVQGSDAAVNFDNGSTINDAGEGVRVVDTMDDGDVSIGTTASISEINGGRALFVQDTMGAVTVDADMTNSAATAGGGVEILRNMAGVTVAGEVVSHDASAIVIDDSQATIGFSGDVTMNGTAALDAISITDAGTNTADDSEVSINGSVTNNAGGEVVSIVRGDDDILFGTTGTASTITDNGDGISITGRASGATATFNSATTLTNANTNSVELGGIGASANATDSTVTFANLTIDSTNAPGAAINGQNVGDFDVATGSITSVGAAAINLDTGSSTNGLVFTSIDVSGAANAIVLTDFDGTVSASDGALVTTGLAVDVDDSGLILNSVSIDSATNQAIEATYSSTNTTGLLVDGDDGGTNESFNGGSLAITTNAAGGELVSVSNVDDIGAVSFDSNGSNTSSFTLSNVTTNAGFTYDVDGAGSLTVGMTDVTGSGATSLTVTSSGDGTLNMTDVNTGSTITATSNAGADGDLTVNATNSGTTTAFTGITVNDLGDGSVSADFNNVESTSSIDFDSAGTGNATLEVNSGSYGGDIDALATNTGTFTVTMNGTSTVDGVNGVVLDAQNGGDFTANVSGVTASNGGFSATASADVDAASVTVASSSFMGEADLMFDNIGTLGVTISGNTVVTGSDNVGLNIVANSGATTGNWIIQNNDVTTGNERALNLDIDVGDFDMALTGNDFINNGTNFRTADIDIAGGGTTLDATIFTNTFLNSDVGPTVPEFEIETSAGSPTLNLNFSGNTASFGGGTGNGEFVFRETTGTFGIFERDDTLDPVSTRNNGTVTIEPDPPIVAGDFDDLAAPPTNPAP